MNPVIHPISRLLLLDQITNGGGGTSNALTFADSVTVHGMPEKEIKDRVQTNNLEACTPYDPVTDRFYNSGYCKPYSPKYNGMAGLYYYSPTQGFYDAIIDTTERQSEPDYHVANGKIYFDEDGIVSYLQEDMHAQDNEIWRSNPDLHDFQKIFTQADPDIARGMPYRTSHLTPGTKTHVWLIQKQVGPGDVSTLAKLPFDGTNYGAVVDIIVKGAAGHRVYTFKPFGQIGPDDNLKFWIEFTDSSSEATYEKFLMWTLDFDTFHSPTTSHQFTVSVTGAIDINTARANGYKMAGIENSIYNLSDHCGYVSRQGEYYSMYYEDYHDKMFLIRLDPGGFTKMEIDLGFPISGLTDKNNPYEITSTADSVTIPVSNPTTITVTVGLGVTRLTELIDIGGKRVQLVKDDKRILLNLTSYDPVTGVMEGESTGVHEGVGTFAGWSVRTAGVVDGVTNQFCFERNNKFYCAVRVILPDTYRRLYLFESSDYKTATIGSPPTFTFVKDLTPGVANIDAHKSKIPENINDVPDHKNFVIWTCKAVYDSLYQRTGTNYCLVSSFGTIQPTQKTFDAAPYANRAAELADISWRQGYSVNDVVEAGGSITQVTDITGNGHHIVPANAACYKESNAIRTYGSCYLPMPNVADFRPDKSFVLMVVAKKIGTCHLLSGGHPSDTQQYIRLSTKINGSLRYHSQTTAGAFDQVDAYTRLIGDEYAILTVYSNGKHLRFRVNGVESDKSFTDDAPKSLVRWFNALDANLNNVLMGARIAGTSLEYTPLDLKEIRYAGAASGVPVSLEQITRLEKTWSIEHGITLGSFGTAQTYEPEVHTTVARMNVAPSSSDLTMYDSWVKAWKTAHGLPHGEHCLGEVADVLPFRSAHDSQASLLNFARPRFDSSIVGAPVFTAYRGWKSAASGYLNWNFNPSIHSRWTSSFVFVSGYPIEDTARGLKTVLGLSVGTNINVRLQPRTATDTAVLILMATTGLSATSVTNMLAALFSWRAGTSRVGQRNTTEFTATSSASAFANANVFELAENDDGVAVNFLDATVAFPLWGSNAIDEDAVYTFERNILLGLGVTGI